MLATRADRKIHSLHSYKDLDVNEQSSFSQPFKAEPGNQLPLASISNVI